MHLQGEPDAAQETAEPFRYRWRVQIQRASAVAIRPAWRAVCLAYRRVRATDQLDYPAQLGATAAVLEVLPHLTEKEASQVAVAAIAYTTSFHAEYSGPSRLRQLCGVFRTCRTRRDNGRL